MASCANVSWFADVGLDDRPHVGGKGGSLGELQRAGIAVPPGFVVRTEAFERYLQVLERESPVREVVAALNPDDLQAVTTCSKDIRARIESAPLPQSVAEEIATARASLSQAGAVPPVAVRSSATTEDAADASFAGLQDTYLWVKSWDDTLRTVRSCWASLYSVESITYRLRRGFPESGVAMAVVIQTMVDARTAGVMFTRSPTTGDRSVITIEGAWGLGSSVVGGEVTPDRWVIGKITGEITVRDISAKQIKHVPAAAGGIDSVDVEPQLRNEACMSDAELEALRSIARIVERHYGRPQDIEWAVDRHSNNILLLQSRPETVWAARDATPVAKPAENPLSHVMSNFWRPPVTLTAKDVAEITRLLEASNFDELYLEFEGLKLSLRRQSAGSSASDIAPVAHADVPRTAAPAALTPVKPKPADVTGAAAATSAENSHEILAPLLGTFYRAPKPGAAPFVEIGAALQEDTIIGIIEVMKLMNTVRAGVRGTVYEILARDGVLVEYGETLMRVSRSP